MQTTAIDGSPTKANRLANVFCLIEATVFNRPERDNKRFIKENRILMRNTIK